MVMVGLPDGCAEGMSGSAVRIAEWIRVATLKRKCRITRHPPRDSRCELPAAIRNPVSLEVPSDLTESEALEQLTVLSVLARWIDSCDSTAEGAASRADQ